MTDTQQPLTIVQIGNFRPAHSTENELRAALVENGHRVIPIQEDHPQAFNLVAAGVQQEPPAFVLWTRTWIAPPSAWSMLDACRSAGVPTVAYHLDLWHGLDRAHQVREEPFFRCDIVCTPDPRTELWARAGVNHVWMPPGVGASHIGVSRRPDAPSVPDVVFVGSWGWYHSEYRHRRLLIRHLRSKWGHSLGLYPARRAEALRGQALIDVVQGAKVVVGDSCFAGQVPYYWSDRVPETLGRGGYLIHPEVEGLGESFGGLPMWPAGDWGRLDDLIRAGIGMSPAERAGHCERLVEHVAMFDTYTVRMRRLISLVNAHKAEARVEVGR